MNSVTSSGHNWSMTSQTTLKHVTSASWLASLISHSGQLLYPILWWVAHSSIDCVGPLPHSKSGTSYPLTIMCQTTRYPTAYPLYTITRYVVKALAQFISIFGIPKIIQSDQGSNVTSHMLAQVLKQLHIKQPVHCLSCAVPEAAWTVPSNTEVSPVGILYRAWSWLGGRFDMVAVGG